MQQAFDPTPMPRPCAITTTIESGRALLIGELTVPPAPRGVIAFAGDAGAVRADPHDRHVAARLAHAGFATLLVDLLGPSDAAAGHEGAVHLVLADRLTAAVRWLRARPELRDLPIGLFGTSRGAAAALLAATRLAPELPIAAIVSRGGRPELADPALGELRCPTLLIVGGRDPQVLAAHHDAIRRMAGLARIHVVGNAGHQFDEPGALDEVAAQAIVWFRKHLAAGAPAPRAMMLP